MSKNFAITGVAGFVAPRHLKAIKDSGNTLVAAVDPHDSVGILDSYFPDVSFFTEFERFDRHIEKLRRSSPEDCVDYISICSPNHLHDAHIRLALRSGADALCEKPLVLNPWNLDMLAALEKEYEKRIWTVLQLRVHPSLIALKEKITSELPNRKTKYKINLQYITSRGKWYHYSWKGDDSKAGGIITNIGIHFFDLLIWLFGDVQGSSLSDYSKTKARGRLELQHADVDWLLSISARDLPADCTASTFRSITIDGEEIEFSSGFTDLHTRVYEQTLEGNGFGIADAYPSIKLVHDLRNSV